MKTNSVRLEIHEHSVLNARCSPVPKIVHSHEGGHIPHKHPNTGPASYTIDKDDWARTTGLRGGGRKTFTAKPRGTQLPIVELEDWQKSFELCVVGPPTPELGEGPGVGPAARMMLGFGMTCVITDER